MCLADALPGNTVCTETEVNGASKMELRKLAGVNKAKLSIGN